MKSMRMWGAVLGAMVCLCLTATARDANEAVKGRDVGDGNTRLNIPYDPKNVKEMLFLFPTVEHPYYEIVVPMGDWDGGASASAAKVRMNGAEVESYYVFVDGLSHVQGTWITRDSSTAKNVVLVARTVWHNGEDVKIEVDLSASKEKQANTVTRSYTGKAPAKGGGPEGWRRYQSVVLTESVGVERKGEPVECSLTVRREHSADLVKELRLFSVGDGGALTPRDLQTFNEKEYPGTPPGTSLDNYLQHPSRSAEVVFLADVPANDSRAYVFFYDNPSADAPKPVESDLTVTGPSLGAKVENKWFVVKLDDHSGQIAYVDMKGRADKPVPRLTNSYSRAVHWNPDSFSDNGKWGHTFAWNPPDQTITSARGPLMFRVTSRGRMPDSTPQVDASVTYSFYAGVPYVKASTVTEVREPLNADAIRNGEVVLDSHLITHFVWEEKNGDLMKTATLHGANFQDEWTTRVEHDVPWIGMTNELDDYGIGVVVESSLSFNANRGEATTHRPAYYLYYHHMWRIPVTYFTRGWVYPFSDYQRGPIIPVDPGSTYVEKEAFVPFFLHNGDRRYSEIQQASEQIHNPLSQRWGR